MGRSVTSGDPGTARHGQGAETPPPTSFPMTDVSLAEGQVSVLGPEHHMGALAWFPFWLLHSGGRELGPAVSAPSLPEHWEW